MSDERARAGINAEEGLGDPLEPDITAVEAAAPATEESGLSARVLLARMRQTRQHEIEEG